MRVAVVPAPRRIQAAWLLSAPAGRRTRDRNTSQDFFRHLWCTMCANHFPNSRPFAVHDVASLLQEPAGRAVPTQKLTHMAQPGRPRVGRPEPCVVSYPAARLLATPQPTACRHGHDESESIPSCPEMQKAPGCPGAFVLQLCFYSLRSRETMQQATCR